MEPNQPYNPNPQTTQPGAAPAQPTAYIQEPQPMQPPQAAYQPSPTWQPQATPAQAPNVAGTAQPGAVSSQPYVPQQPTAYQNPGPGYTPVAQQSYTATSLPAAGSASKKVLIVAIAGAIVLIIAGVGLALLLTSSKKGTNGSASADTSTGSNVSGTSNSGTTPDVTDRKDGTLDLSQLIDNQTTIKDQLLKGTLNQQINLSNGFSYLVTSVDRNFVATGKYPVASDGKELVKLNIVVGNRQKKDNLYTSGSNFFIKNSAGGSQNYKYATKDEVPDILSSNDIAPGKQVKGSLIFQVDKNEKFTIDTEDKYTNYTTKKDVTVASEVTP